MYRAHLLQRHRSSAGGRGAAQRSQGPTRARGLDIKGHVALLGAALYPPLATRAPGAGHGCQTVRGGEQSPDAYSPFGNRQIRLLLRTTDLKACLTEEEAATTTRLLIESLGAAIANATYPPGDAERVLRAGEPEQRPGWDTGKGEQTCAICAGELNGTAETL
eukprot:2140943-Pyramimonas_sp.AAC.1